MSEYIKQTWVDGETPVDAEHMNHLEEGVAAAHKAIAELPEIPEIPDAPVQSVNGKTGDVALTASDVGALPADAEIIDTTARAGVAALSEEMVVNDIPLIFYGDAIPQVKDVEKTMSFDLRSRSGNMKIYCETKAQGNSSMAYPKKNQTTKFYRDAACTEKAKVNFRNWGKQNKYCLKANWIDLTHARNIVSARIWGDVVRSRANFAELPELLRTSPNVGAIDGFPVKVYAGGVYQGRYTLNIPKDAWMANMDDENPNHCILCGENFESGWFRAPAVIDGSDWSDEVHDTVPDKILTRWNQIISFVMTSTDEEFCANLGNYFDVQSLIDYHIFNIAICGLDAYGKNQLYMTYDGQKWIACMYDMDSTFGLWWDGSKFVSPDYDALEYHDPAGADGNLLYIRMEKLFHEEIKARWDELRDGALSYANILARFEEFIGIAPNDLVKEDYAATTGGGMYTEIPSKDTNNIQQIRSFTAARRNYADWYIGNLPDYNAPSADDETNLIHSFTTDTYSAERWTDSKDNTFALEVYGNPTIDGNAVHFDSTSYAVLNKSFDRTGIDTTVAIKFAIPSENEVWFACMPNIADGLSIGYKPTLDKMICVESQRSDGVISGSTNLAEWTDTGYHVVVIKYVGDNKVAYVYYDGALKLAFKTGHKFDFTAGLQINNEAESVRNVCSIAYIKMWDNALDDDVIATLT